MQTMPQQLTPAGFWTRVFATILDGIILVVIMGVLMFVLWGPELFSDEEAQAGSAAMDLFSNVFGALFTILFWHYKAATPGKIMMGVSVVDSRTGGAVPLPRLVLRYVAYLVSILPLFLGFVWVAFDRRKQGFHDKIANTLVVHNPGRNQS